jgi:hypothetical protein
MEGDNFIKNQVGFISYNSCGFSPLKTSFIRYLASLEVVSTHLHILCNQENFLLRDKTYKILKTLPGFQVFINPAIKEDHGRGHPINGMFIAVPNSIKNFQ